MERAIYLDGYQVMAERSGLPIELRRGGAGVTYKAQDLRSGAEVAVEVNPILDLGPDAIRELEREAAAARQLDHVNIPKLIDFGRSEGQLIYVTESFDGTSAEAWVKENGPMPAGPALRIATQVVSALGASAFHNIQHRALNPRNIMLVPGQTAQGEWPLVKILSLFGVMPTFTSSRAAAEEAEFALDFASPEQLEKGMVDFRSEIYSLGATLWFLLTGAAPNTQAPLPRISRLPKAIMHLLTQMLARDPEARPRDPLAFQEHLRACLEQVERRENRGQKIAAPLAGAGSVMLGPTAPRRAIPWQPLALAALALILVGLGAVMWPGAAGFLADKEEPLGVPVGVPESAPPAAAPAPATMPDQLPADSIAAAATPAPVAPIQPSEEAPAESAPAPAVVAQSAATAVEEEPPPPAEGPQVASAPSPSAPAPEAGDAFASRSASAPPPATERASVSAPEPIVAENDPPPPPPPAPAVPKVEEKAEPEAPTRATRRRASAERAEARDERLAQAERAEPVEEPAIEDLPVLPAEPVREEELIAMQETTPPPPPRPRGRDPRRVFQGVEVRRAERVEEALPRRSRRARFIGTAPDGSLVFELPDQEEGYVRPRR